ncbi:MAG TPA: MarR family transcriptional regulator [Nocardioides sp.]|nr:MarR family transcriptional regulator [Nocardioides sp.]
MATVMSGESSSAAVRLRQAELQLRQHLDPLLREHHLLMDHWRILAVIGDNPGIGMSSVAAAAVVPAATLTRHADRLVELGLVLRHVDPADRRRVVVSLSPRGQALTAELHDAERRALAPADGAPLTVG